jgi:hopene-associated glycosyltransferase HpnB
MSITLLIACVTLAIWCYLLTARGFFWRVGGEEGEEVQPRAAWPEICVVIPARNEADMLHDTLPTVLNHDYPNLRVVLVDDRSEDATAQVARHLGDACPGRLTVVSATPMPGWSGKVAAMQRGLEQIAAEKNPPRYVLFTDADILYQCGVLKRLVAQAEAGGLVLTSLMVKLRCKSMAEQFLIPAFVYFFRLLYPFRWVNAPRNSTAAAAGGCMLVRYDALMQAGGFEPIRGALIDDCALGRLMKQHGPIRLAMTQNVHSARPYPDISDIRAMVARSAYNQLDYSPLSLTSALLGMVITYIAPVLLAIFATGSAQLLGAASWLLMSLSFIPMLRFYQRSPLLCLTLPLVAAFYMGFTLDSARQYARGKGGLWKGRVQAEIA